MLLGVLTTVRALPCARRTMFMVGAGHGIGAPRNRWCTLDAKMAVGVRAMSASQGLELLG